MADEWVAYIRSADEETKVAAVEPIEGPMRRVVVYGESAGVSSELFPPPMWFYQYLAINVINVFVSFGELGVVDHCDCIVL